MQHRLAFVRTLVAMGLALGGLAHASVVIGNTRVIYRAADAEATVRLVNDGRLPALTQAWIDAGDPGVAPAALDVPFLVTPPVARIDPDKGQTLRIVHTGHTLPHDRVSHDPLPHDRESVFYLNVLEVPPTPKTADDSVNLLQMAFRTRIKLFFRPVGLDGVARDAPARLTWRAVRRDGRPMIEAINPTPYHVTFAEIFVGAHATAALQDGMIGPYASRQFALEGEMPAAGARIRFGTINDYGGTSYGDAALAGAAAD